MDSINSDPLYHLIRLFAVRANQQLHLSNRMELKFFNSGLALAGDYDNESKC